MLYSSTVILQLSKLERDRGAVCDSGEDAPRTPKRDLNRERTLFFAILIVFTLYISFGRNLKYVKSPRNLEVDPIPVRKLDTRQ
jgi:hypothetical protein